MRRGYRKAACTRPTAGACAFTANTHGVLRVGREHGGVGVLARQRPGTRGTSRYFIIGMQLPTTASTDLQGEEALFSLTWHMTS